MTSELIFYYRRKNTFYFCSDDKKEKFKITFKEESVNEYANFFKKGEKYIILLK